MTDGNPRSQMMKALRQIAMAMLIGLLVVLVAIVALAIWDGHEAERAAEARSAEVSVGDCLVLDADRNLEELNSSMRIEWSCDEASHHGEVLSLHDVKTCSRAVRTVNKADGRGRVRIGTVDLLAGNTACVAFVPDGWSMTGQILAGTVQVWAPGEPIPIEPQ
jgi:hypothetical protein